jgi:signal transduction histidine kinase
VWTVELAEGVRLGSRLVDRELPQPLQRALTNMHPVLIADRLTDPPEDGFAALGRSGMYMALRARGALVGLIALEDVPPNSYGPEQRELLESLSSLLALSIDNARWFARLRTLGAEAERARIARELHDRVAQTIYQLRANVSEVADIVEVATGYLEKFADRTGIETHWLPSATVALPYRIEQEVWRIGQEALVNVERHSGATEVTVCWDVRDGIARLEITDDGVGFEPGDIRGEHYGLVGMRERADAIGARITIERAPVRGTRVAVEVTVTSQMTTTPLTSAPAATAERRTA